MPIIQILVTLIVIGFLLWVVNQLIPMDGNIKKVINVFVVVLVVLWLVSMFFPVLGEWRLR
jgi:hypothetical protein